MAEGDVYRHFIGPLKFDPREGEAAGKEIRSFVMRGAGVKEQAIDVRCTLWPSHSDFWDLKQGDLVFVEGKFTTNKAKDKSGEPVTYCNLSVSSIIPLGAGNRGARVESVNKSAESDVADDDDGVPY